MCSFLPNDSLRVPAKRRGLPEIGGAVALFGSAINRSSCMLELMPELMPEIEVEMEPSASDAPGWFLEKDCRGLRRGLSAGLKIDATLSAGINP